MKLSSIAAVMGAVVVVGTASLARAQEKKVAQKTDVAVEGVPRSEEPPRVVEKTETTTETGGPSRAMMASGVVTFGLAYIPSVVVAATSDRTPDHRLYIPFAGPWMALPDRGGCGGETGHGCNAETTYKVLLVVDGIVQALGGVLFVRSFFTPEVETVSTTTRAASTSPTVHLAPTVSASGYGLTAIGAF